MRSYACKASGAKKLSRNRNYYCIEGCFTCSMEDKIVGSLTMSSYSIEQNKTVFV